MTETRYWLLRCHTGKEFAARDHLQGLGYEVIAPEETRYRKRSRYQKSRISFQVAALPGYLIVGFANGVTWAKMLRDDNKRPALGIVPMMANGDPVRVRSADVAFLRRLEREGKLSAPDHYKHQHRRLEYDEGDIVEVLDGPLQGYTAQVGRIEGGVVEIKFALLGKDVVKMPAENLAAVAKVP